MSSRLRVGVPSGLLELPGVGGHGKVWNRTLAQLSSHCRLIAIDGRGVPAGPLPLRRPQVVLASGHEELPQTRLPLVVEVHEAGWFDPAARETLDPGFLRHIQRRTEQAVQMAHEVITLSEASRQDLIAHYGLDPDRVHAVHPGVDPVFRRGAVGGRALVAAALGGTDRPYVLYAATLHPRKNLAALRNAIASIAADGLPHALAIAGMPAPDRADSSELQRAAAAELPSVPGRIAFLGQPSDEQLAALMADADAFCLPSLYEGFGLTALEAMACGTPVVVSDRASLPEVVGDAGIVVQPSSEAIAGALRGLLRDPARRRQLAEQGAERAREFSWERTASGWLAVLRRAAVRP